jgi:biotin operon repressor
MSFQAMTWAVEQELPALQKLVLLMLANCSNHHTGQCNPSHERLAKECGMSRTSVKDAIRALSEKGLVEIVHIVHDGVNLPNQYKLLVSTPPGRNTTEGGSPKEGGVGRQAATKQEVEPGKETKAEAAPAISFGDNGEWSGISDGIWRSWNAAYPALNLDRELAKAGAWLLANPKNKKSNYARFLTNWFSRAQDSAPRGGNYGRGDDNRPRLVL